MIWITSKSFYKCYFRGLSYLHKVCEDNLFYILKYFAENFVKQNVYLVFTKYFQNVLFICAQAIASRYLNSRNFFRQITQATSKYYTFLKTLGFFFEGNPPLLLFSWVNYVLWQMKNKKNPWKQKVSFRIYTYYNIVYIHVKIHSRHVWHIFSPSTLGGDNHAYF